MPELQSMTENKGKYIVIVDGSVPMKDGGVCSTIAGRHQPADAARNGTRCIRGHLGWNLRPHLGGLPTCRSQSDRGCCDRGDREG